MEVAQSQRYDLCDLCFLRRTGFYPAVAEVAWMVCSAPSRGDQTMQELSSQPTKDHSSPFRPNQSERRILAKSSGNIHSGASAVSLVELLELVLGRCGVMTGLSTAAGVASA